MEHQGDEEYNKWFFRRMVKNTSLTIAGLGVAGYLAYRALMPSATLEQKVQLTQITPPHIRTTYVVQKNDNYKKILQKTGLKLDSLKAYNPNNLSLHKGDTLYTSR